MSSEDCRGPGLALASLATYATMLRLVAVAIAIVTAIAIADTISTEYCQS